MTVFIQTSRALHLVWVTMKHSRACWCLLYRKQENFKLEYLSRITWPVSACHEICRTPQFSESPSRSYRSREGSREKCTALPSQGSGGWPPGCCEHPLFEHIWKILSNNVKTLFSTFLHWKTKGQHVSRPLLRPQSDLQENIHTYK